MDFLKQFFSIKKVLLLLLIAIAMSLYGYFQWSNNFRASYYSQDTSLRGQLFPNVANTTIDATKNNTPFSKVPYGNITIKIGSLSSKYDDSKEVAASNIIIDSKTLDEKFTKWLIHAFDKKEAKKIAEHINVYYRGIKIKEISY
ncbi:hypothetical protein [Lactococcus cremoris]|uniref:Uncharacterized protein n=1 Tax=Lactococcus cremoris subsp. cremoris IBB477 TaxID=1449093 RepID=A0A1E7G143_LACLC|nr:hypothetical protein [Lactococcus cremoris]MCT0456733.1 hypothetical protein [Lactococcus cremoris]MCT0474511.1 hypothetical protein [Lactococcus cremoris]MCT0511541.1 hypothetical protein [Lactococcus cremoris]MDU8930874.1 hypothetical protein [Lactococcus cremoris]OEU38683.1 hypothetical protein AJ89_12890 [Lactococcus cremoris subsp. cremoris IBB477]